MALGLLQAAKAYRQQYGGTSKSKLCRPALGMFASEVLIAAGADDAFCVWLPSGHGRTIDTYISLLKEPPPSIAVRLLQFCPADGEREAHRSTPNEEPIRLKLPDKLQRG